MCYFVRNGRAEVDMLINLGETSIYSIHSYLKFHENVKFVIPEEALRRLLHDCFVFSVKTHSIDAGDAVL